MNVVGGLLLTVTALYRLAYPNMIINLVWIAFGFYALLLTFRCPMPLLTTRRQSRTKRSRRLILTRGQ